MGWPKKKTKFTALRTKKTGDVGERIAHGIMQRQGLIPYSQPLGGAPIDFLCLKPTEYGFEVAGIEVKTYARRFSCYQTGVDTADYWTYKDLAKIMPLSIIFIDPFERCIYGLAFREHQDKALFEPGKVYFSRP